MWVKNKGSPDFEQKSRQHSRRWAVGDEFRRPSKMVHCDAWKISTSTSHSPSPCEHVAALVDTKLRRVWKWVFGVITVPTLTNPELRLLGSGDFRWWWPLRLWVFRGNPLTCQWCARRLAKQVSLCAIKEASIFAFRIDEQSPTKSLTNSTRDHFRVSVPENLRTWVCVELA